MAKRAEQAPKKPSLARGFIQPPPVPEVEQITTEAEQAPAATPEVEQAPVAAPKAKTSPLPPRADKESLELENPFVESTAPTGRLSQKSVRAKPAAQPVEKEQSAPKPERKQPEPTLLPPLFVGIDLGTSRTTIMSSRGAKGLVRTVVGYPKDIIGVMLTNSTLTFGDDALERQSYLDIHYPLENGLLKADELHTQAARELMEHAIFLAKPQPGEKIFGIVGVPAEASITSKNQLLAIAQELMDVAMVISEPFMVAYGLVKLKNAIIIDIGAGSIDICAMKGNIPGPDDQITLFKGGDFVDQCLARSITENHPKVQMTPVLARKIKDQFGFVGKPREKILVNLRADGRPVTLDLTREIRGACETLVKSILDGVEALIQSFDPDDQGEAVENIVLAGGGSNIKGLDVALATRLRDYGQVQVHRVADPDYAGSAGALKLASELPPEYWNQLGDVAGNPEEQSAQMARFGG
ncbi:MAG: rod shape-determining protein [Magnetococcales bacterium]|nr:rod shape-determining protein [Magnetococcales bacterium]